MNDATNAAREALRCERHSNGQMDIYEGSAAEIAAAGLARLDQLPGYPGRPFDRVTLRDGEVVEHVRRFDLFVDAERWARITRTGDDIYRVSVGLPKAERLRRRARHKQPQPAAHQPQQSSREAEEEARFRTRLREDLARLMILVLGHFPGHESPFVSSPLRFPAEDFDRIQRAFAEVWDLVLEAPLTRLRGGIGAARADPAFQRFLASQCLRE